MTTEKTGRSGVIICFKCQKCGEYNKAKVTIDDEDIIVDDGFDDF